MVYLFLVSSDLCDQSSMQSHFLLLPHWHRIITGWKLHTQLQSRPPATVQRSPWILFTSFLHIAGSKSVCKSCIQMCPHGKALHALSPCFRVCWANFTPVKILYKAYPSSHSTAKCKKAQQTVLQGIFLPFHLHLVLFFHYGVRLKKLNNAPLCIKCKLHKVKLETTD